MGFALLGHTVVNAGAATNADMTALTDPDFTTRSGHYIFTEEYELWADFLDGATVTRGRYQAPMWNAIGEFVMWPPNNGAAVVPSNPQPGVYLDYPPRIPVNEEFQAQVTCTAAETDYHLMVVAPPSQSRNLPRGRMSLVVRATGSVAKTLNSWSGPGAITLAQSLRGGVYCVWGAQCFCANALAFRLVFPRSIMHRGRKMRPGWLCQNAVADVPAEFSRQHPGWLGAWGFFHTFELPQVEVLGNVAGAATQELRLWITYLGEDLSLLDSNVMSMGM